MARLKHDAHFVHEGCTLTDSTFGAYTEIGLGSRVTNSNIGDYSYCDRYGDIANADVGKFANIASFVRIGATDHPLDTAACHHFLYRSQDYWDDARPDEDFLNHRKTRRAVIGHDTWIGHGTMIKPEVTLGHGAVVATAETQALIADLPASALVFALDETGKPMSSLDFARAVETARDDGARDLVFLIGGADGHDRPALPQGARMLSFGKATWPHKLVRVMLAEQLYRAASVLAGAPYHREG